MPGDRAVEPEISESPGGAGQKRLAAEQIEAFYHDEFVEDQVRDFDELMTHAGDDGVVVDVGGGVGFFAWQLRRRLGRRARVLDTDPASVERCRAIDVDAVLGDALSPAFAGDETVACFNLVLHHLVGRDEAETRRLQRDALRAWRGRAEALFVNEYIYESVIPGFSGRMIYEITSSGFLSRLAAAAARWAPALRANTFGVGVRFRSHREWERLFAEAGYRVADRRIGRPERIAPSLRALLISTIRRDSFRLEPIA